MKKFILIGLALTVCLLAKPVFADVHLTAKLTVSQEVHDVTSAAKGTGVFTLHGNELRFSVTVEGLSGPIVAAHFHHAPTGQNGSVVHGIIGDLKGNTAYGVWRASDAQPLTPELIAALMTGRLYVNVHTANYPGGEVRGQIVPSDGTALFARLTPEQEAHAVTAEGAAGTAAFSYGNGVGLAFYVTVNGLSGNIAAAHIHVAETGVSGGVIRPLTTSFAGNAAYGLWTAEDNEPLTAERVRDLLLGKLYINVHTGTNPAGELRGQILLNGGWGFTAAMDTTQESHTVNSGATATAVLTYTPAGLVYRLTAQGLSGDIAGAHFHAAPPGTNGSVIRAITGDFAGMTAAGVWLPGDAQPFDQAQVANLLSGNLYLNIHTSAYPAGEIRGQVLAAKGTVFSAELTTAQEVQGVTGNARGTAYVVLNGDVAAFRMTVNGLSGPIQNAHFHKAAMGINGGVVRGIAADFVGQTTAGVWTGSDTQPLTAELIRDLLMCNLYLNVHTPTNGGGEIRGQVLPAGGTGFFANMSGAQDGLTNTAAGTGTFLLTGEGLVYDVTVTGLSDNLTAAHFHKAPAGINGSVVRALTTDFKGNTAAGVWRWNDPQPLTAELVKDLLAGNLYVNVHTAMNPTGEVRGQVYLNGGIGAAAVMTANQEVQSVTSAGKGSAALTLTDQGIVFNVTVNDLTGTMAAAHFHRAPVATNGGVVRPITADFDSLTAFGVWTPGDPNALTTDLIIAYLTEGLYLNAHTQQYPQGEIRGQISTNGVLKPEDPTDIDDSEANGAVTGFALLQNQPNPFNRATRIAYALPRSARVTIEVYNIAGQKIQTLVDQPMAAGQHETAWDGKNDAGQAVSNGLYFYRLKADAVFTSETRRAILLK